MPPFSFDALILFGWLSALLLAGILLRARLGLFQRYLIPSCLIGGVLGLALVHTGIIGARATDFELWAYHLFNISFISVGLTKEEERDSSSRGGDVFRGSVWMALMQGVTLPVQAIIGGGFVLLFGLGGLDLHPTFGFLAPLGFNEGPGQALSFGKVWEGDGFAHAGSIGLTFATLGYMFAFLVGVPLVNRGLRRGKAAHGRVELSASLKRGIAAPGETMEQAGRLTMHSGNVESLAFQAGLIGLVYLLTYGLLRGVSMLVPPDVASNVWGFFFVFGLVIAMLVAWVMKKFGAGRLIDPGIQRRLTGWSVDYLLVATVTAIQLVVVWEYLLPIMAIGLTVGILTTLAVTALGRRLWRYNLERTAAIYGVVTGTVSCGLLLLRIVDPDFETPVAVEIGVMNLLVAPFTVACMVLVNAPVWWDWSLGATLAAFVGVIAAAMLFLGFLYRRGGKSSQGA